MGHVVGYDGVKFPATQAPSSDANTLDDYEENTWTPTLTFGGGSTGLTYTTRTGVYVKIGQLVWFTFRITLSAKGSSTGNAAVSGFPFAANAAPAINVAAASYYTNLASLTDGVIARLDAAATSAVLQYGGAASMSTLSEANFTNTSDLVITGSYRASA